MTNEQLERVILLNLQRVDTGLKQKSLQCAVEIEMDRPDLTTSEFEDAMANLERKGLIEKWQNLLGATVWGITDMGRDALKGL